MFSAYMFIPSSISLLSSSFGFKSFSEAIPVGIYWRSSDVLSKDKQKGGGNCAMRKYNAAS
jgi:hypothetical protein